ncbi:sensor histidine kinase, partial [Saccharothrix sp. MB29]|nr:sensor histidine kinase [Saccharothrix sp. MB29]
MFLFWRIFLLKAAVLVAATGVLLLGPVTVSTPALMTEVVVLTAGLGAMLVLDAVLLRVGLAPLERLTRAMATADLLKPHPRTAVTGRGHVPDLIRAFNRMLDRLEAERGLSAARALSSG